VTLDNVHILEWRPVRKAFIRGFVAVRIPQFIIRDCPVLYVKSQHFVAMPSRQRLDRDGQPMHTADGKTRWSAVIAFTSLDDRDQFSAAVLAALDAAHPDWRAGNDDDQQQ
jgi:DNA-binding cell septation regulator SpoVG